MGLKQSLDCRLWLLQLLSATRGGGIGTVCARTFMSAHSSLFADIGQFVQIQSVFPVLLLFSVAILLLFSSIFHLIDQFNKGAALYVNRCLRNSLAKLLFRFKLYFLAVTANLNYKHDFFTLYVVVYYLFLPFFVFFLTLDTCK